ncbi:MAG TPA: fructose-6-phosphate aldolase [Nitrospiria bacterium]|nr:fructose-6-phosphate aldolase [Nitrospiria bacterium]
MKLFLDSANLREVEEAVQFGLIDGVTTNPSLASKEGRPFHDLIREICRLVKGPVSAEVVSIEASTMISEGRTLAKLDDHVVVKIPLIPEGLKAIRALSADGIRVNTTLIFSSTQALLAAKAGAAYVSPFIGRLDDISQIGMELIEQIVTIFQNYSFPTEVLVASIRNPTHVVEAALLGADVATMPYAVLQQLAKHPLTDIGLKKFLADWEKMPKK